MVESYLDACHAICQDQHQLNTSIFVFSLCLLACNFNRVITHFFACYITRGHSLPSTVALTGLVTALSLKAFLWSLLRLKVMGLSYSVLCCLLFIAGLCYLIDPLLVYASTHTQTARTGRPTAAVHCCSCVFYYHLYKFIICNDLYLSFKCSNSDF